MTDTPKKETTARRNKTIIAFEKVFDALRILNKREWRNGEYEGGPHEVCNLLAYFENKYVEDSN